MINATNVAYVVRTALFMVLMGFALYIVGNPVDALASGGPYPGYTSHTMNNQVTLSQIPYTGFDFGLLGNSLYFLAIALFAAAGAYLIVYWKGGVFAFLSDVKQQFWG